MCKLYIYTQTCNNYTNNIYIYIYIYPLREYFGKLIQNTSKISLTLFNNWKRQYHNVYYYYYLLLLLEYDYYVLYCRYVEFIIILLKFCVLIKFKIQLKNNFCDFFFIIFFIFHIFFSFSSFSFPFLSFSFPL